MARSNITSTSTDLISDSGSAMLSVVKGEQLQITITIGWVTDLTGYNIFAKLLEGINVGGGKPNGVKVGGVTRLLNPASGHIIFTSGNTFKLVLPWDLSAGMVPQPEPDMPVYMYIDLEVGEPGSGTAPAPSMQIWKPLRGLVEISYSPTEV